MPCRLLEYPELEPVGEIYPLEDTPVSKAQPGATAAATPCKRKATTTPTSVDMAEEAAAAAPAGEPGPEPLIDSQAHGLEHPGGRGGSIWSSDSGVFQPWPQGATGGVEDVKVYLGPTCAFKEELVGRL